MVRNPPTSSGEMGLIPGWGRSPEVGNGNPLCYYCLENPMGREVSWATVHGVTESWTRLTGRTAHGSWLDDLMHMYTVKWSPKSGGFTYASHHKVTWVLKISSLGRFQVYNTPLLTIATMLYIWAVSPHLFHPGTCQPQFYSLSSTCLSFYRQKRSYSIFLSLPGSFHLAQCPLGSHKLSQMAAYLFNGWIIFNCIFFRASLVAQMVKNLPEMQETQVWSLGWKDPPGEGYGNPLQYSVSGNSHGQRSLVGYSPWGSKQSDTTEWLTFCFTSYLLYSLFF